MGLLLAARLPTTFRLDVGRGLGRDPCLSCRTGRRISIIYGSHVLDLNERTTCDSLRFVTCGTTGMEPPAKRPLLLCSTSKDAPRIVRVVGVLLHSPSSMPLSSVPTVRQPSRRPLDTRAGLSVGCPDTSGPSKQPPASSGSCHSMDVGPCFSKHLTSAVLRPSAPSSRLLTNGIRRVGSENPELLDM